ncbi:MAG TPA: hypothetical protein DIU20_11360, partial [Cryomorphaceae bacterium]|nr:hypothetical protein [Cryomorphaceae bacterium]
MGVFVVLLPLVVAVFRYRNLSGSQRWLVLMLAIVATNQLLAKGLIYFFHINNLPFFHLYIAVESFFLLWLFRYELSWRLKERWLKAGGLIMVGLVLINGLWVQPFTEFPSNIRALESVVIIG